MIYNDKKNYSQYIGEDESDYFFTGAMHRLFLILINEYNAINKSEVLKLIESIEELNGAQMLQFKSHYNISSTQNESSFERTILRKYKISNFFKKYLK